MQLRTLPFDISVCQLKPEAIISPPSEFYCLAKTREELSLVCKSVDVPSEILKREDGWRGFYIDASLDFSLVGIMARISGLLAQSSISLFAISTFNTDYFLVKKEEFAKTLYVLEQAGYTVDRDIEAI